MIYSDAEHKYMNDPKFHAVVKMLLNAMEEMQVTPIDVRDAAFMACVEFERRHIRYTWPSMPGEEDSHRL